MRSTNLKNGFCAGVALFMALSAQASEIPPEVKFLKVTFDVTGERFQAEIRRQDSIDYVLKFAAGKASRRIPRAPLEGGSETNSPWSWHLDANEIAFAIPHPSNCDGVPSYIEANHEEMLNSGAEYSPCDAKIVIVEECTKAGCKRIRGTFAGRSPAT